MNKLPIEKRVQILSMLCEGSSMRSISRVVDVSINTVAKLLVDAGNACVAFHDRHVQNVKATRVQCNEIWSFCYAKNRNVADAKAAPEGAGDVWTWTALESDTKLLVTWAVGSRNAEMASILMHDLQGRLANRVQLTTDGHRAYLDAVAGAFGDSGVDYAMLVKLYGDAPPDTERKYSPSECVGTRCQRITGDPDPAHISTSHTERHNLTMRMSMKRFARLSNAFSKKVDNHCHMIALYAVWYNFVKMHKTLRMTPAMAAGVTDKLWSIEDIAEMIDATLSEPGKRGRYVTKAMRADAAVLDGIKAIIRDEWSLPDDFMSDHVTAFARELRERIQSGDKKDALYIRASLVQVHDMRVPISPAHRAVVDRVYAFLSTKNSN